MNKKELIVRIKYSLRFIPDIAYVAPLCFSITFAKHIGSDFKVTSIGIQPIPLLNSVIT